MYQQRRQALRAQLGPGAAAIVASPHPVIRSRDTEYPYRADSNVLYLTGFEEPDAVALILPEGSEPDFVLFVNPRDPEREQWTGRRVGVEGAKERYGAGEAHPVEELTGELEGYLEPITQLYLPFTAYGNGLWSRCHDAMRALRTRRAKPKAGPRKLGDLDRVLGAMRRIKSAEEIAIMRKAAEISGAGHAVAATTIRPGVREYEVEAAINHAFRHAGGSGPAYTTIVGAGANATILHYVENRDVIQEGDAVLVDAGAEYGYYAGDITRTYPASGRFSGPQRDIYNLVLAAEERAIAAAVPGGHFKSPHDAALEVLMDGLRELKLLEGSRDEILEEETFKRFFMHSTSHYLGLDTHDVGEAYLPNGEPVPLEAGVVLTVEPGIYIKEDDEEVPEAFRGIGVRIEDDILITESGHEVLTASTPKALSDVEWG